MNTKRNILLIYTGGTIGMIKDSETGALQNFNFDELLKYIPELNLLECNIASHSFLEPIDSSNMNPDFWVEIGIIIEDNPMAGPNTRFWDVIKNSAVIGTVTSAVFSPRLKQNIGLALVDIKYSDIGEELQINNGTKVLDCKIVKKPFYDPNKSLTKT